MTDRPDIQAQIDAVENDVVSKRGWLASAEAQTGDRAKSLAYPIMCTRMHLPALEAAIESLRFLQSNREAFLAFLAERKGRAA